MQQKLTHEQIHENAVFAANEARTATTQSYGRTYEMCQWAFEAKERLVWNHVLDEKGAPYKDENDYSKRVFGVDKSGLWRFAKVWKVFSQLHFDHNKMLPMRNMFWLSYVVDQNNVADWLERCQGLANKAIVRLVREANGGENKRLGSARGRTPRSTSCFSVNLTQDELYEIEEHLLGLMKRHRLHAKGEALMLMCSLAKDKKDMPKPKGA